MTSTIITKNSSTASAVPLAADLTQGELAVNVTDKKLYSKDSGGAVVKLVGGLGNQEANAVAITGGAVNGTTVGATTASTGAFTTLAASGAVTLSGGTANGVTYLNGSKVLTSGSALNFNGTSLGIGVTPNTWSTGNAIQFGTLQAAIWGAGDQIDISGNAYFNSGWKAAATKAGASLYEQALGVHTWSTSGSVTADSAITFAEGMRLTSTGLGIGTSSPTAKVHAYSGTTMAQLTVDGAGPIKTGVNFASGGTTYGQIYFDNNAPYDMSVFQQYSTGSLRFGTNNTERARIDSSGNLLVGTTSAVPGSPTRGNFYNAGSASAVVGIQNARNVSGDVVNAWFIGSNANNTSSYFLQCGVSGVANVLYIYGNGNVQNTNNSYGGISDVKLKENIVDASPKLADLMQVKVRNYNFIGNTTKQIGVVAQELEEIFPAMVDESPDRDADNNALETTTKSVKYSVFVPMLIKAIQELKAEFDAYKASHP